MYLKINFICYKRFLLLFIEFQFISLSCWLLLCRLTLYMHSCLLRRVSVARLLAFNYSEQDWKWFWKFTVVLGNFSLHLDLDSSARWLWLRVDKLLLTGTLFSMVSFSSPLVCFEDRPPGSARPNALSFIITSHYLPEWMDKHPSPECWLRPCPDDMSNGSDIPCRGVASAIKNKTCDMN